jgi:uncharacterized membrane protein
VGVNARFPIIVFVIALEMIALGVALAQSGGTFGGGGFSNQNPPASPISPGGGDSGSPLNWLPYAFSFGGGNGVVLLLGVFAVTILVNYLRRSRASGLMGGVDASGSGALRVQVMLLQAEDVKHELHQIASTGDTTTPQGLCDMVRESVLSLMRHPERWVYATVEQANGSESASAGRVSSWATAARAAYQTETVRNQGRVQTQDYQAVKGGTYCVITVVVAAREFLLPLITPPVESNEVRAALTAVSGVTPESLISAEVVWSPDAEAEFLTEDQALRLYPSLYHL